MAVHTEQSAPSKRRIWSDPNEYPRPEATLFDATKFTQLQRGAAAIWIGLHTALPEPQPPLQSLYSAYAVPAMQEGSKVSHTKLCVVRQNARRWARSAALCLGCLNDVAYPSVTVRRIDLLVHAF